jgi:hypothetical protein
VSFRIIYDVPPMYDEIDTVFAVRGKPVIFAWGDKVYMPGQACGLSKALTAHEAVHCVRQLKYPGGVEAWWRRYMADPQFRLDEEIPAHRAELAVLQAKAKGPSMRIHALSRTAARLAAPLYGNLITIADAKKALAA